MTNNLNIAQEARISKTLSLKLDYPEFGILTRAEYLQKCKDKGYLIETRQKRRCSFEEKEQEWLTKNAMRHPWGNEKHPDTIAYNIRKNRFAAGYFETVYQMNYTNGSFSYITKIEFDHFQKLKISYDDSINNTVS